MGLIVGDVDGRIDLKVLRDVPSEAKGDRICLTTLKIDLRTPRFVEIVGVAKNRFSARVGVNGTNDEFVMFQIVPPSRKGWGRDPLVDQLTKPALKSQGSRCIRAISPPKICSEGFSP